MNVQNFRYIIFFFFFVHNETYESSVLRRFPKFICSLSASLVTRARRFVLLLMRGRERERKIDGRENKSVRLEPRREVDGGRRIRATAFHPACLESIGKLLFLFLSSSISLFGARYFPGVEWQSAGQSRLMKMHENAASQTTNAASANPDEILLFFFLCVISDLPSKFRPLCESVIHSRN